MLERQVRELARITITSVINDEFRHFVHAAPYQRTEERTDHRNGVRSRNLETRFGLIEDIPVPRARHARFLPKLFTRGKRREKKIVRAIAGMFINGISTHKVRNITKALRGRSYRASTVSRCNRVFQEEYLNWINRPIERPVRYLFLDAINLKVRRHWISKEALLCTIGITDTGTKEFLGFLSGGRESTRSWENLLFLLLQRGLPAEHLTLIVVDCNAALWPRCCRRFLYSAVSCIK